MLQNKLAIHLVSLTTGLILAGQAVSQSAAYENMVLVPVAKATMQIEYSGQGSMDGFALDKLVSDDRGRRYVFIQEVDLQAYYIDKTEVTNEQYKAFLDATGYQPECPDYFLHHWRNGSYLKGMGNHPVIWVSLEDAKAYADWAGKRLPTDEEWQLAAQGLEGRIWPWGNNFDPARANMDSDGTKPVGSYPTGASPYGCLDMAGNVWEWVGDVLYDGYHRYSWLRGGGYFHARESSWCMRTGPITNMRRVKLFYMTPAMNRSGTVGFRCVKDAD